MQKIRIINGTYKIRGKDVDLAGMVFPLVCLLYTSDAADD